MGGRIGCAVGAVLFVLVTIPFAQASCPRDPMDCYNWLLEGDSASTDDGGVLTTYEFYKEPADEDDETTDGQTVGNLEAGAWQPLSHTQPDDHYHVGDRGGVLLTFEAGQSDANNRTLVNVTVTFPQQIEGIAWIEATSVTITVNLSAPADERALPFDVIAEPDDGTAEFPFTTTANPGQNDTSTVQGSVEVGIEPEDNGTPGVGPVLLLAVVAAAAVLYRRRT